MRHAGSFKNHKKCTFEWSKVPKTRFSGHGVCWIVLILPILIELYVFEHLATLPGHGGSFKSHKKHFWMIQIAKNEFFWGWGFYAKVLCNVNWSWRTNQKSLKSIFEWSKVPKKKFLAIFRSWVCWIDLILQIVIELNVLWHLATSPGREGPFKNHKNPQFWMIQSAKRRFLAIF